MRVYSLFDRKLREYGGLVLSPNDDSVKRAIHEGVPPNSTVGKYPEDYDLMYLGEFDPLTGQLKRDKVLLVDNVRDILRGGSNRDSSGSMEAINEPV